MSEGRIPEGEGTETRASLAVNVCGRRGRGRANTAPEFPTGSWARALSRHRLDGCVGRKGGGGLGCPCPSPGQEGKASQLSCSLPPAAGPG